MWWTIQEDSRDLTEGALLSAGYTDIVTAASGWEALKILDVGRTTEEAPAVDVVLLDIVMPEMDGVEACARIRNDARYADMPIIMVTSLDDMDSLANAFVAGATDYITKPVNRVELVARVRAALRLKQELDRRLARERELLAFLSNWGDRRASSLIDEATGLFVGEAAEAYLTALAAARPTRRSRSWRSRSTGSRSIAPPTARARRARVLAEVARAVRRLAATVGIVAGGLSQRHDHSGRAGGRRRVRRANSAKPCARRSRSCACRNSEVGRLRLRHRKRRGDHRAGQARRSTAFTCSRMRSPRCRTRPARAAIACWR